MVVPQKALSALGHDRSLGFEGGCHMEMRYADLKARPEAPSPT